LNVVWHNENRMMNCVVNIAIESDKADIESGNRRVFICIKKGLLRYE
jgi:hypothetical protein